MKPPSTISWPAGLDATQFLERYWQQAPLLLAGAFPGFDSPIDKHELAGLALDADEAARLILHDPERDTRTVETGPFDEARFRSLEPSDWSLLVTDVEKLLPELDAWLTPFRFLPAWRIDDLMISHAPDGASVGAHVDEYDVFLLQATGQRLWQWGGELVSEAGADSELERVLSYRPAHEHLLRPGDMLYLPPGAPHHGLAVGDDCTTWSIGFRAPTRGEMVSQLVDHLADELDDERYRDPRELLPLERGRIDADSLAALRRWWLSTADDDAQFARAIGRWLSDTSAHSVPYLRRLWMPHPSDDTRAWLFVDGECHDCRRTFAMTLCECEIGDLTALLGNSTLQPAEQAIVEDILDQLEPWG